MNNFFFACFDCKMYLDAGGRWAHYCLLKKAVVSEGGRVDAEKVLASDEYWNPPSGDDAGWLREQVIPTARQFLMEHQEHHIVFGDSDTITPPPLFDLDWLDVGYLNEYSPRYFVEVLRFTNWEQATDFVATSSRKPWWWDEHCEGTRRLRSGFFTSW